MDGLLKGLPILALVFVIIQHMLGRNARKYKGVRYSSVVEDRGFRENIARWATLMLLPLLLCIFTVVAVAQVEWEVSINESYPTKAVEIHSSSTISEWVDYSKKNKDLWEYLRSPKIIISIVYLAGCVICALIIVVYLIIKRKSVNRHMLWKSVVYLVFTYVTAVSLVKLGYRSLFFNRMNLMFAMDILSGFGLLLFWTYMGNGLTRSWNADSIQIEVVLKDQRSYKCHEVYVKDERYILCINDEVTKDKRNQSVRNSEHIRVNKSEVKEIAIKKQARKQYVVFPTTK